MSTRKSTAAEQQAEDVETVKAVAEAQDAPQADLANVDTSTYASGGIEGPTGTVIDGVIDDRPDTHPFAALKALGNAKPDVSITAVENAHHHWTWTARKTDGGRVLARGGPHSDDVLVENLQLLFGGSTVALHSTGDDKVRKLS